MVKRATLLALLLILFSPEVKATADNPQPHGPARDTRCVSQAEWLQMPIGADEGFTRREVRKAWGVAGFKDQWRTDQDAYYYAKCGVRLSRGYVWVSYDLETGKSWVMLEQSDFNTEGDWQ